MKTKRISLLPSSQLYFTSVVLCWRLCLFILPIASLPCVLGNVQSIPFAPHGPCSWFLGRYPRWNPLKLVYIFSNPTFFSLASLFLREISLFTIRTLILLLFRVSTNYRYPLYHVTNAFPPILVLPFILLFFFTKLFSRFLCVLVVLLLGRG